LKLRFNVCLFILKCFKNIRIIATSLIKPSGAEEKAENAASISLDCEKTFKNFRKLQEEQIGTVTSPVEQQP
jgi:hypothetical protein